MLWFVSELLEKVVQTQNATTFFQPTLYDQLNSGRKITNTRRRVTAIYPIIDFTHTTNGESSPTFVHFVPPARVVNAVAGEIPHVGDVHFLVVTHPAVKVGIAAFRRIDCDGFIHNHCGS